MPVNATDKFRQSPFAAADHVYIDGDDLVRDLFVEHMFNTLFTTPDFVPTDAFKHNFALYCETCFQMDHVPPDLLTDPKYAVQFLRTYFGLAQVKRMDDGEDDPDYEHCTHTCTLRTRYSDDNVITTHAPGELNAALLAIVTAMRWVCDLTFRSHAYGDDDDADTSENN